MDWREKIKKTRQEEPQCFPPTVKGNAHFENT